MRLNPIPLVLCTVLAFGCNKNHDEARANATSTVDAQPIAEFSSLDSNAWVNGPPASLADARGKHVVLIEVWHPT